MLIKTLYYGWIDTKDILEYDIINSNTKQNYECINNCKDYKVVARTEKYEYTIISLLSEYCCGEAIIEEIAESISSNKPSYNAFKSKVDNQEWWRERKRKCLS